MRAAFKKRLLELKDFQKELMARRVAEEISTKQYNETFQLELEEVSKEFGMQKADVGFALLSPKLK